MTTTDLVITDRSQLPAVDASFVEAYGALDIDVDVAALVEEAMGPGGQLNLSHLTAVKVPAADLAKSFIVPDDNGDDQMRKTLTGIPVAVKSRRSFWVSEDITGTPPDCKSMDLVHGVGAFGEGSEGNPTGLCTSCPMAARGSAGKGTQASRCKEQRIIFLLTGDLLPYMVIVPPGSLPNFNNFGAFLFKKAVRGMRRPPAADGTARTSSAWLRVELELGMEQDTNPAGQDYNKITFKQIRRLTPEEAARVNLYGMFVDDMADAQIDAALGDETGEAASDIPFDDDGLPVDEVGLDEPADAPAAGGKVKAGAGKS